MGRTARAGRRGPWARVGAMRRWVIGGLAAASVQALTLVLAHELVFLARWGSRYNEALVHAGHGEAWTRAVLTSLFLAGVLAVAAGIRLVSLGLLVRRRSDRAAAAATRPVLRPSGLLRAWRTLGPRTAILGATL